SRGNKGRFSGRRRGTCLLFLQSSWCPSVFPRMNFPISAHFSDGSTQGERTWREQRQQSRTCRKSRSELARPPLPKLPVQQGVQSVKRRLGRADLQKLGQGAPQTEMQSFRDAPSLWRSATDFMQRK